VVICGIQFELLGSSTKIATGYDPALPSSQGSPESSKRECSAVVLIWHESIAFNMRIGLPQHSGTLFSSAPSSTEFPQFSHSYTCFSAMNSPFGFSLQH
jgi:hypothetical protein